MNAIVNDSCISCGLCADTCPAVFHMGDDGMAHGGEVPAEMLADAETALRQSGKFIPWQVVTLGRDGNILE